MSCDGVSVPPNFDNKIGLCCDPPSVWNKDWPIDPEKLWEEHFNNKDTDKAVWSYDTQYNHNDEDPYRADAHKIDGSDAYGFMMLNGKKEAVDDNFATTQTVVRREAAIPNVKRNFVTTNRTLIDAVFDHHEEVFDVYCNFPPGSPQCESVWEGGVEDTIISLPDHVGEGPFARVVSMELVAEDYTLPGHHLQHRAADGLHDNPVYRVKVDYNFHLVRQDRGPVQIRVDYTNLLGYWREMTDSAPSRIKRDEPSFNMGHFRERVQRAEAHEKTLKKRRAPDVIKTTVPFGSGGDTDFDFDISERDVQDETGLSSSPKSLAKRWWGSFVRWLEKMTTVREAEKGDLPLGWADTINLFKARWGCPGKTWSANLRLDLEASMEMQATYAYYYSGTFIPPSKPDVFFYFGVEPEAYVGLRMVGSK